MIRRLLILVLALCLAVPTLALARSGGSAGGGSFGRSRSSGSSSGSRSFGGSSSGSRSSGSSWGGSSSGSGTRYVPVPIPMGPRYYGTGYGPAGGGGGGGVVLVVILVIVGIFVVVVVLGRRKQKVQQAAEAEAEKIRVTRVTFGVQDQAWPLVEGLREVASRSTDVSPAGLQRLLLQAGRFLRKHEDHIAYGAVDAKPALPPEDAQRQHGQWAGEARLTYDRETVRSDHMGVQTQAREVETDGIRDEDGQLAVHEFFVVILVIAHRGPALPGLRQASGLSALLDAIAGISVNDLVAVELIWTPDARSDAMSRDDMESRFAQLRPL